MLKKSIFYEFLNRRQGVDFDSFLQYSVEDEDYINWNQFVLPGDYGDAELEYQAIRNSCALFDVSPMRKYQIRGKDAGTFLDHLLTRPVSTAKPMQGIYVAYCNQDGSLKDDSILYKYADDDYLLMPSDIDHSDYFESLRCELEMEGLSIDDLSITDCTHAYAGMAVQGPLSATVLEHLGFTDIELLQPFEVKDYFLGESTSNIKIRVARMGFTADLGYECWMETDLNQRFTAELTEVGNELDLALPGYGLTALEACRIEGGFVVVGWDCASEADPQLGFERSPYELGIGWLVDLNATDFVGKQALVREKKEGGKFVKRCFTLDAKIQLEDGSEIFSNIEGQPVAIGSINCSSWSWGMQQTIGNASIKREFMSTEQAETTLVDKAYTLALRRGPLLKLDRQQQTPAKIFDKVAGENND